jgi:hypothetical protein
MFDIFIPIYAPDNNIFQICTYLEKEKLVSNIFIFDTNSSCPSVKNYKKVIYNTVDKKLFHHAKIRNKYLSLSKSKYVIFMTQDACFKNNNIFKKIFDYISISNLAAFSIRQSSIKSHDVYDRVKRLIKYPNKNIYFDKFTSLVNLSNTFAVYKSSTFIELGGFPTEYHWAEDIQYAELAIKNGYKIGYFGKTSIKHSHDHSLKYKMLSAYWVGGLTKKSKNKKDMISAQNTSLSMLKKAFKTSFILFLIVFFNLIVLSFAYYTARVFETNKNKS